MHRLALFGLVIAFAQAQEYQLQSAFAGGPSFLDNFDFWTSWDPTFGYVHYVSQETAEQHSMINITDSTVAWGVDTTQILSPSANLGRLSIRLTTKQTWTHGLFVLDLAHMPDATCGVWPSVWALGEAGTWPSSGEIDMIEFVNKAPNNLMALHTTPGCTVAGAGQTGTLLTSDCSEGNGETGCTVSANAANDVATSFNANGGGVYAMEWTSAAIRIWFFPRKAIPQSIALGAPDVNTFGTPVANFQGSCDIDAHFFNQSIVFNTDFCGQWAGPTFQADGCPALEPDNSWQSCNDFVALNPGAFVDTYWEVNYLNVYQTTPGEPSPTTSSLSSVTPAISTSAVDTALSNAQGRSSTPTQSIAATTPTAVTGSFTATSSVLSVLSSLSVSSSIASAESASLAGREASSSTPGASSFSSISSSWTLISTTSAPSLSVPTSSSSTCTEATCTSYVIVVETVTAVAGIAELKQRAITSQTSATTTPAPLLSTFNRLGNCEFTILGDNNAMTDYACTFSQLLVLEGTLMTEHVTVSTTLSADDPLQIGAALDIDHIVVKTEGITSTTSLADVTFTGTFNASTTSTASTTITARPVGDASDVAAPLTVITRSVIPPESTSATGALHIPRKKPKHMTGGQISFCGVPGQFCEVSVSTVEDVDSTITVTLTENSSATSTLPPTEGFSTSSVLDPIALQPSMAAPDVIGVASLEQSDTVLMTPTPSLRHAPDVIKPASLEQSDSVLMTPSPRPRHAPVAIEPASLEHSDSVLMTPSPRHAPDVMKPASLEQSDSVFMTPIPRPLHAPANERRQVIRASAPNFAAQSSSTMVSASSLATPSASSSGSTMVSASSLATPSASSSGSTMVSASSLATPSASSSSSTTASASRLSTPTPPTTVRRQAIKKLSFAADGYCSVNQTVSSSSRVSILRTFSRGSPFITEISFITAPIETSTELRQESEISATSTSVQKMTPVISNPVSTSIDTISTTHPQPGFIIPTSNAAQPVYDSQQLCAVVGVAVGIIGIL